MSENVNNPKHYAEFTIEVLEAIESWDLGFHLGNATKYCVRAGLKNELTEVEDLKKAIYYIRRKIELIEADQEGREPRKPNETRVEYI